MPTSGNILRLCGTETGPRNVLDVQTRQQRLVMLASYATAAVTLFFAAVGFIAGGPYTVAVVNLVAGVLFLFVPSLRRIDATVEQLTFILLATATLSALTILLGTSSGLLFYFIVMAAAAPMIVGPVPLVRPIAMLILAATAVCILYLTVPADTHRAPDWLMQTGLIVNVIAACAIGVSVVTLGVEQTQDAEAALADQFTRSEALLDNILPRSVSDRLKSRDADEDEIADTFDDASILFADIVGFTEMSSRHTPSELVDFLNNLYLQLDTLTNRYGLEKIKTTGDSYMVVSGVPEPRPDHLETLVRFALDMRAVCDSVPGPDGHPMHLRVGLAAGPVVAGVVGSKKFFYDVWGDAVNLASRMESTGEPDHIQVPQSVKDRLEGQFEFIERGTVAVKGKGDQHTWLLVSASSD